MRPLPSAKTLFKNWNMYGIIRTGLQVTSTYYSQLQIDLRDTFTDESELQFYNILRENVILFERNRAGNMPNPT